MTADRAPAATSQATGGGGTGTERLRILHVGPLPPPVGGMASVVNNLRGALATRCEVQVLDNVKTTPVDRTLREGVAAQLRLIGRLRAIMRSARPQVVHIHTCSGFTFWRNGLDLLLARLGGARTVLHIHGAQFHEFLGRLGRVPALLARALLRRADRVVVLGDVWQERLQPWCRPGSIVVLPNGVFVPAEPAPMAAETPRRVVCVANYERRKGLADLIRAVATAESSPRLALTVVGAEAEAGHRQELAALASTLGIPDRVHLSGPVDRDEVGQILRDAHVFALSSYNEGLPMSLLEAMACGLPVVASRVGAVPEAVTDGVEGLLFDPGDIAALARGLDRLAGEPVLARSLGASGRQRVIRAYSVEHMADELLLLYRELLRPGGAAAGRAP